MAFPKQNTWILISFDFSSVLTIKKVAYKSSLDNLLECFLPSTLARIISVLPEKYQKFLEQWGLQPARPPGPYAYAHSCNIVAAFPRVLQNSRLF